MAREKVPCLFAWLFGMFGMLWLLLVSCAIVRKFLVSLLVYFGIPCIIQVSGMDSFDLGR